jgi:plastocyanin
VLLVLAATGLAPAGAAQAERLWTVVREGDDDPVKDAVVYAVPLQESDVVLPEPERVEIDQVDKEFVPHVTAVAAGASVGFPNHDQIRHHVYSFSETKTFEIPLYKGTPSARVDFDEPGQVTLGCNIHDWMRGYVFVSETPWFAVTNDRGAATIDLPPGEYRVEVWHPHQKGESATTAVQLVVEPDKSPELRFAIETKKVRKPRRSKRKGKYRR